VRLLDAASRGSGLASSLDREREKSIKNSHEKASNKNQTLVASCLRGALPPVDLRAVCLVRAMTTNSNTVCFSFCERNGVQKINWPNAKMSGYYMKIK
jgi:hypothetical protein